MESFAIGSVALISLYVLARRLGLALRAGATGEGGKPSPCNGSCDMCDPSHPFLDCTDYQKRNMNEKL